MERIWQAGRIGPMELKNRTVRSATNEHLADRNGMLTQAWADTEIELARNEVGLVITGHFAVDPARRADEGQPAMLPEIDREMLRKAADGVHSYGGRIVMQLNDAGLKAPEAVNGQPPKGPDDFTVSELMELRDRYVAAAVIAKECGFDGVQVHCAHGYFLSSFLDPNFNHRTDEYGGSYNNRFRLPGEIIRAVRDAVGTQTAVLVKMDSNSNPDFHHALEMFAASGIDAVEISGVDFGARKGEKSAFYLDALLEAGKGMEIPFILTGGIFSLGEAERVLEAGIPFVGFSRSLICEPGLIAAWKAGMQNEAKCLACNGCYQIYRSRYVRCVQHKTPMPQLEKVFGAK